MKVNNWLFVTGAPRSGTTFVGKVLSLPLTADYIHEPFNPDCGIRGIKQRFFYMPAGSDGAEAQAESIARLFEYRVRLRTGWYPEDTWIRKAIKFFVGSRGPFFLRLAKLNAFRRHAIIKDPIGCLLTEYLAVRFGVRPIIMVRHPAAFVASFKRLGWPAHLEALRAQSDLCERYFPNPDVLARSGDQITDVARLWWALHTVIADQVRRHPEWTVLRHEDMGANPLQVFRALYRRHDLPWSERVERRIIRWTGPNNPKEAKGSRVQDFRRDSGALFKLRVGGLTDPELHKVREITSGIASQWYPVESYVRGLGGSPSVRGGAEP